MSKQKGGKPINYDLYTILSSTNRTIGKMAYKYSNYLNINNEIEYLNAKNESIKKIKKLNQIFGKNIDCNDLYNYYLIYYFLIIKNQNILIKFFQKLVDNDKTRIDTKEIIKKFFELNYRLDEEMYVYAICYLRYYVNVLKKKQEGGMNQSHENRMIIPRLIIINMSGDISHTASNVDYGTFKKIYSEFVEFGNAIQQNISIQSSAPAIGAFENPNFDILKSILLWNGLFLVNTHHAFHQMVASNQKTIELTFIKQHRIKLIKIRCETNGYIYKVPYNDEMTTNEIYDFIRNYYYYDKDINFEIYYRNGYSKKEIIHYSNKITLAPFKNKKIFFEIL